VSRLDACLDLMARADIDVMLLGREANARTVSDAGRLWLAGTRAFSPGCVVVRRTGAVHLLSNTDSVVPPGFPIERLYGVTWNPEKLVAALDAIDGVHDARRVAVDGMSPMAKALLARITPDADVVDAGVIFGELWRVPDPERIAGVDHALVVAHAGLDAMATELRPGTRPRDLRGVCAVAFASRGVTTPAFEAVVAPLDADASTWIPPERALDQGERVVLRAGVIRDGWEASLARTYVVGSPSVEQAAPGAWNELVAACTPGTTVGSLREWGAVVNGAGRGVEPWPDDLVLVADLMLALEVRDNTSLRQDILLVT
jgi:Xaa-Pro dipeptidase